MIPVWVYGAIALALVTAGFGAGFYTERQFAQVRYDKLVLAQTEALAELKTKNLEVIKSVQQADAVRAKADADRMKKLEDAANALLAKLTDGPCLDATDVDSLRDYWDATSK